MVHVRNTDKQRITDFFILKTTVLIFAKDGMGGWEADGFAFARLWWNSRSGLSREKMCK